MSAAPHIVMFNPDQWRGDVLGHMGNAAALTPTLDTWAASDAVSFRNAFCQSPVCTPSRCSFMSGWYPHVRGHRTMHHLMRPDEPVLLRSLKQRGYSVWWGGKNDLVADRPEAYCDVRYVPRAPSGHELHAAVRGAPDSTDYYSFYGGRLELQGEDEDWESVRAAIAHIRGWDGRRPLCLYLALGYPHPPYAVEEPWFSAIERGALPPRVAPAEGEPGILAGIRVRQRMQSWSEARWDELRATYYGMCARVDHQFDLVLSALREAGMYDDTAIFFFSDHGDFTGDYGLVEKTQNTFQDCLVRVPLLVKPPAGVPVHPGVSDVLVELVDVPATVEAFAGIEPGHTHFGRSLRGAIAGETGDHRDAVFCEGGRLRGERQAMELDSVDDQVPSGLYWPRVSLQRESDALHTKAAMCRTREMKYVRRLYERDELYDLREDPGEQHNVIDDARHADERAALADRLLTWFQETSDAVPTRTDERD